jgi:hypothetical protein
VLEDGRDLDRLAVRCRRVVDYPGPDQLPLDDELVEESRGREGGPVVEAARAQQPQDAAVGDVDAAIRVAEGARLDARKGAAGLLPCGGQRVGSSSSALRKPKNRFSRRQYIFATTAPAAAPPASAWSRRLPLPASMYPIGLVI